MVGWVAPSVHAADSCRSGGGKELQEHFLNTVCVCMGAVGIIWGRMFTDGCVKGSRDSLGLHDSYYEMKRRHFL